MKEYDISREHLLSLKIFANKNVDKELESIPEKSRQKFIDIREAINDKDKDLTENF